MGLWQGILIILGCIVAGSLVGLLLMRLLRRKKEKESSLLNKETNFINSGNGRVPVDTKLSNGMTKSNGHEDPLELLIKNHKTVIAAENATQSRVTDMKREETVKSELIIEAENRKQPESADVLKRKGTAKSELILEAENRKQPEATDVLKRKGTAKSELILDAEKPKQPEAADVLKREGTAKSELILEMEANLVIASKPWAGKLISFQTKCWDSKHGEFDSLLNTHHQELLQLYVDIGLANNIVWLATEINHRTKELDESYIRLCSGIADNIKKILL